MEHEYEGGNFVVHLIAGAAAGTAEHCGMFPVDTIKTHIQAARPGAGGIIGPDYSVSLVQATRQILSRSGMTGLFRGITAMAAGAAPAHALHFSTYEACKQQLGGNKAGHHPFATGISGIAATLVSEAVLSPTDAIKQRMQLHLTPYKGIVDCIKTVMKREGIRAFYSGYFTTLTMGIPYHFTYFASYESLVTILKDPHSHEYNPIIHFVAGGGAGMLAAAITNPFDVARTRLQTQGEQRYCCCHTHQPISSSSPSTATTTNAQQTQQNIQQQQQQTQQNIASKTGGGGTIEGRRYTGLVDAMRTIWKEEGRRGYMKGLAPRMIVHSMSAAICWSVYEYIKVILEKHIK